MSRSIRELREMLSPEDVKNILRKFGVEPVRETNEYIIYPTVDHNLEGGSNKLYYYKKNRLFKSYTGEQELFDIFQLVINMHHLRGKVISLKESVEFCDIENNDPIEESAYYRVSDQLDYLYEVGALDEEVQPLIVYPETVLSKYIFNTNLLNSWIEEGIGIDAMMTFGIKFDVSKTAIVIPYRVPGGDLVGVRGRFLGADAVAKYMPMKYGSTMLAHPTSKILYGLYENAANIKKNKCAILFEGEKSVLKIETIYGRKSNIALAVSGRTFSIDHVKMLVDLDIEELIIAFDRDYKSHNEIEKELESLRRTMSLAKSMFNVSVIVDWDFVLKHKNSPIDQGKEIFDDLLKNRLSL